MPATGADILVGALESAGVEVVFGLPGVHNLPAWEALRQSPIRLIGVRHEQAAAYAADGYARVTGKLGVALVTTGPGAANTLGATGEAWASRSPVLVIATDIPTGLRGPGVYGSALHECTDQAAMFGPVTKGVFAFPDVAKAISCALSPPTRPVYLEIPTDLLAGPLSIDGEGLGAERRVDRPQADEVDARLDLGGVERPLVWAGGGARDMSDEVVALAERLGAPIITTYTGRGIAGGHPLLVGLPPHLPEVGALWEQADLVVTVGSDLDGMNTQNWRMPQPPRLIAVNVDPEDASKNYETEAVVASPSMLWPEEKRAPWADLESVRRAARERLRTEHPAELGFLDAFAAAVPDDTLIVCDMCIPGYWLAGMHPVPVPRRLLYPMGWGTLGFAFPASLGASAARKGPVVSVNGDGGFLFACGELATVAQERLPMTIVIVDDGGYGMLRFDQRHSGNETYGVDLSTPDFVKLAAAFGIEGEAVEGLGEDFTTALARHIANPEPSLLVAHAALEPPPTTSPRWHRTGPPAWAR